MVLGGVDVDEFVASHLHHIGDWERNFKALKIRGRDAEKLPRFVADLVFKSWLLVNIQILPELIIKYCTLING